MEPLNDDELNKLLQQWKAPVAPASLARKVLPRRESWWRWMLSGTIRVPVPVGLALLAGLVLWIYTTVSKRQPVERPASSVSLADFQPVKQLEPRIVRSGYEGN
jgi:hypothetical protein